MNLKFKIQEGIRLKTEIGYLQPVKDIGSFKAFDIADGIARSVCTAEYIAVYLYITEKEPADTPQNYFEIYAAQSGIVLGIYITDLCDDLSKIKGGFSFQTGGYSFRRLAGESAWHTTDQGDYNGYFCCTKNRELTMYNSKEFSGYHPVYTDSIF